MLSIKELRLLRTVLDSVDVSTVFYIENKDLLHKTRDKICDLITIQNAWNTGKQIQMEDDCCF